ncbi:MAG: hypothetical protein K6T91_10555 [Firmicutes bacterium]|nr:hypothetical protein [Bacillota bacterium]
MGTVSSKTAKSKSKDGLTGSEKGNRSIPAIVILALIGMTLILFETFDAVKHPLPNDPTKASVSKPSELQKESLGPLQVQLDKITAATKKKPFRAKVITESGFKEYWIQSGLNQRFEDPSGKNIVILNYAKKKLWLVNMLNNTASEISFDTQTANFYRQISPAFLIGGLIDSTTAQAIILEDILPSNNSSRLKFTKDGLPARWDGIKSNNTKSFVDWVYIRLGDIESSNFELPENVIITHSSSAR